MRTALPILCLVVALASLFSGFAMLAMGAPEATMELHRARVSGDEAYQELLEEDLERRQLKRTLAIVGLFVSSAVFTAAAFVTTNDPRRRRP